jgi:CRISPR-associated protein Csx10
MTAVSEPSYLRYCLTLRSPAVVTTLSGDPNLAATQAFVPGSAVRGALASRLISAGIDGDSDEFRALVLSGSVRYLHAYPEAKGERSRPVPASWKGDKNEAYRGYDLAGFRGEIAVPDDAEDFETLWPSVSLAAVSGPFVAASSSSGSWPLVAPRRNARAHQQRDRVKGRPWKDKHEQSHGALFAYEYLEAEQRFRGVIQVMPEAADRIERIKALLAQPIFLGRARRAGYGGEAALTFEAPTAREFTAIQDAISEDVPAGKSFRVLLTSAYVGRHPATGQIDPGALDAELGDRLHGAATVQRRLWDFERIGGFNQKWRLEVPQAQAVAAGALLVLKANRSISVSELRHIEHEGLGERRAEGFGRMLFAKHVEDTELEFCDEPRRAANQPARVAEISARDRGQLDLVETRVVLAAAREELDRIAVHLVRSTTQRPASSLLGRLRTVFRGVTDDTSAQQTLSKMTAWCSDGAAALQKPARSKLEACKLPQPNLLVWLRNLSTPLNPEARWEAVAVASGRSSTLTGLASTVYLSSQESAQGILHSHAAELSAYLIDAVLAELARGNRAEAR